MTTKYEALPEDVIAEDLKRTFCWTCSSMMNLQISKVTLYFCSSYFTGASAESAWEELLCLGVRGAPLPNLTILQLQNILSDLLIDSYQLLVSFGTSSLIFAINTNTFVLKSIRCFLWTKRDQTTQVVIHCMSKLTPMLTTAEIWSDISYFKLAMCNGIS